MLVIWRLKIGGSFQEFRLTGGAHHHNENDRDEQQGPDDERDFLAAACRLLIRTHKGENDTINSWQL